MKFTRATLAIAALTATALFIYGCCGGGSTEIEIPEIATTETGGGETGGGSGEIKSCNDHKSLSTCSTHESKAFTILGEDFFKGICELVDGTWGTAPCPTENQVGSCDDGEGSVTFYYSDGGDPYDAAKAEEDCKESLGTFKK